MKVKYRTYKNYGYAKRSVFDFVKRNRPLFIIFIIIFLIAFFTAILTSIKSAGGLTLFNLADKSLKSFLKGETSLFGLWFSKFINCSFYVVLIYVFSLNKFLICGDVIFVGYFCFMFTINSCVLIIIYGISAVLYSLLIYFLLNLIIFILFIFLICYFRSISCRNCFFNKRSNGIYGILITIFLVFTIQIIFTPFFTAPIIVIC